MWDKLGKKPTLVGINLAKKYLVNAERIKKNTIPLLKLLWKHTCTISQRECLPLPSP